MPPAKRSSSSTAKSKTASRKPAASRSAAPQAKATATTARKAGAKTGTQAKSGATKTAKAAASGAKQTASAARAGAKQTATTAKAGAKQTASRAKATRTRAQATGSSATQDTVTLTRARVQEALDSATERGHITRKDANALVTEIMRRGRHTGDDVGELIGKGRKSLESATKKVRKAEPVDRIVRGADRARRVAGVGPSFPIVGYDDLNVGQIQSRIKELSRPEQRKVLNYERKHANRKSVVGALEKSLA